MSRNKHGLSRHIPEDIKLKIRHNSKFRCVVPECREAIYEYEHLIPEFKDANEHNPDKICLTCSKHNPTKRGKYGNEYFSKKQLIEYYETIKNYSGDVPLPVNSDFFSGFKNRVKIKIGNILFEDIKSIIKINGENILSFQKTEDINPFVPQITFSGVFKNPDGTTMFKIDKNEWISELNHFDLKTTNGKIEIYSKKNNCVFRALKIPDENLIEIKNLKLLYAPFYIEIRNEELFISRYYNSNKRRIEVNFKAHISHQDSGIFLDSSKPLKLGQNTFVLDGQTGNTITGTGITIGKGSGISRIRKLQVFDCENQNKRKIFNFDITNP